MELNYDIVHTISFCEQDDDTIDFYNMITICGTSNSLSEALDTFRNGLKNEIDRLTAFYNKISTDEVDMIEVEDNGLAEVE